MYVPPAHAWTDRDELLAFMAGRGAGHVIAAHGPAGLDATLLPLLVDPGPPPGWGRLVGHLAKANPMARSLDGAVDVLVIFTGADTYVSPSWYPSKAEDDEVIPTWNYEVVHARGVLRPVDDPAWLREHVGHLVDHHEARSAEPWSVDDAPEGFVASMARGILGFEIELTEVVGKRKLSQNRPPEDVAAVRKALAASDRPEDQAVARAMGHGPSSATDS